MNKNKNRELNIFKYPNIIISTNFIYNIPMLRFAAILIAIMLIINLFGMPIFAATEPKLIKVDEEKKEVLVKINGKTYAF
ncbi:MAG: hypothetical protein ACKO3R_01355, partial [bacterium]